MKKHGNTGKQNALKGDKPKGSFLSVRIEPDMKQRLIDAAKAKGQNLSDYVIEKLK